jgi:hypothetical protein
VSLIRRIHHNLSCSVCSGDLGFDRFLSQGGSPTEDGTYEFLKSLLDAPAGLRFSVDGLGCSTMQAVGEGACYFGRNFDWSDCPLLVLVSHPANGYASISSVNMDFVSNRIGDIPEDKLVAAAYYAPLDGMNDQGLCISVNLLPDGMELHQATGKPALTITTAIRLLLDKAATVEEALTLLQSYDLSTTTGLTIHYLIADANGRSVCAEYIHNVLSVVETPVMTNHYLTPGPYFGLARNNSVERYGHLMAYLQANATHTAESVRAAMAGIFHGTQWTAIFDQHALTAVYYQKDDYDAGFAVNLQRSSNSDAK